MDCSVVISACNEYPKICFAAQSAINELEGYCSYEVIIVDNLSTDKTEKHFTRIREPRIKYIRYDKKQSHWCAKNEGIKHSKGKYIVFPDAHVLIGRDTFRNQMEFLENYKEPVGAVHAYHNTINRRYPYEYELKYGKLAYRFMTGQVILRGKTEPYKVGVATTDCMMCKREIFDELGAWHPEFGIRAGGEAYMNFKHGTCGYPHFMHPKANFYHLKEKGYGYKTAYSDWARNNFICAYTIGGDEWLESVHDMYIRRRKLRKPVADQWYNEVKERCTEEMEFIKSKQVMSLDRYFRKWSLNLDGTGDKK